ncbi:hypothetical protein NIES4071_75840 [Calothrix sp. NIES-4071]|nr:hypothetical protein NIES4071_75840 [Calothrix sp. NIES-4071]BAZ61859.1 hypothetical protein NIES4105_75790 [Calothrix sp. NIES-4105]
MNKKYNERYLVKMVNKEPPCIVNCPEYMDINYIRDVIELDKNAELEIATGLLRWQSKAVIYDKRATNAICWFKNGDAIYGSFCVVLLGSKNRVLNINDFRGMTSIEMAVITLKELKLI